MSNVLLPWEPGIQCIIMINRLLIYCLLTICFWSCKSGLYTQEVEDLLSNPKYFHNSIDQLTDVIVHDIFSPPVASRVYAYPCIAAYQVIHQSHPELKDLSQVLNGLGAAPIVEINSEVSYNLAAIYAFLKTGIALIFTEKMIQDYIVEFESKLDSLNVGAQVIMDSKKYGEQVANNILQWAELDNYKESRSYPKYSISDDDSLWKPTPPAYMEGIEPHWREIRTMVLTSADQFKPAGPSEYNLNKSSIFFKETMEVYDTGNNLTTDQKSIASFWDCNPYVMNQKGHMMFATKKITPGGHWMGISSIAAKTANLNTAKSIESATFTAIALFDAFISCWDEKYRSSLVRPETVINEHIDKDWQPLLQTPPFPEHTSGHSVISTAAAHMLTALHGENFSYKDDVELKYGLPIREYNSFKEAASEAAISRLYGGIHYMPAIEDGVDQGQKVGEFLINKLVDK